MRRLLAPGGVLVTMHFSWHSWRPLVAATEGLILKHNPAWSSGGWDGGVAPAPPWSQGYFRQRGIFWHDEDIPFTRESWRGRIRASRGISASLTPEAVAAFDQEHDRLLQSLVGETFAVPHRIDAHILEPLPWEKERK